MPAVKKNRRNRNPTFIRAWREFRGLSQDRVAERVGISRVNYGRIENGKVPYNQDFLEVCAVALNCTVTDLLERDPTIDGAVEQLRRLVSKAKPDVQRQILAVAKTLIENNS